MQSDEEIIRVVSAHKEGKKIEVNIEGEVGWVEIGNPVWNFDRFEFRVAPEPRKPKEFWVCNGREKLKWEFVSPFHDVTNCGGEMIHVIEDVGATPVKLTGTSTTVKASQEINPPRKPREWILHIPDEVLFSKREGKASIYQTTSPGHGGGYVDGAQCVRVREVLE